MRAPFLAAFFALLACTSSGGDLANHADCPTDPPAEKSPGDRCDLPEGTTCTYRFGSTNPACGSRTATCTGGQWEVYHTEPGLSCFDTGTDAPTDADAGPETAAETGRGETEGDVIVTCPTTPPPQHYDGTPGDPCSLPDGTTCTYGYDRPGCGGITATCKAGHWDVLHTDPSAACFDAGSEAPAG